MLVQMLKELLAVGVTVTGRRDVPSLMMPEVVAVVIGVQVLHLAWTRTPLHRVRGRVRELEVSDVREWEIERRAWVCEANWK